MRGYAWGVRVYPGVEGPPVLLFFTHEIYVTV